MRSCCLLKLAMAVPMVHSLVIGGHPRPKGIPQVDTFDTIPYSSQGTPVIFTDGPFVGGLVYYDLDVYPEAHIATFILQKLGLFPNGAVIGGIVPHSGPKVATLPQPNNGRMVALAYEDTPPPCTKLHSSYVACSIITYNIYYVLPVAIPIGCKITWELYNEAGNVTRDTRQQVYIPDAAKISPAILADLGSGNVGGLFKTSPITSQMQPMQLNFALGTKWGVRAEILDLPFALPKGLPQGVADYLNNTIAKLYQNDIQLHLDDVTYTVAEGLVQGSC